MASRNDRRRVARSTSRGAAVRRIPPWAVLAALVALSTALRAWAGLRVPTPWISADEEIYAELGRSLYASGRLEILGNPTAFYSLVYPALAGLPLALFDPEAGYRLLKVVQALAMSLAAIPVYLWGRAFLTPRCALAAGALTLALPGLAYSGLVMTEVAFYPVVVLVAWRVAVALARPSTVSGALAVAALVLAILTRLQALALVPAILTAAALLPLLGRRRRGSLFLPELRRHAVLLGGTAVVGVAWAVWRLASAGETSDVLGAYRAAGETSYNAADAARFVLYHAVDLVLLCGIVPACAVALLTIQRRRDRELAAYLAVTLSFSAWFVAEVGVFASRHIGRLAERDLISLAPLLFLGLAAWLQRGAPRPRAATAFVAGAAVALVAALPMNAFVSLAALPDAFTLIPLYRLEIRLGDIDLDLLVTVGAVAAALVFALVPRRFAWSLAALVGIGLAAVSVSASRVVAARSTIEAVKLIPSDKRWIDSRADGDVAYLYAGDAPWSAVWMNQFWNRRIDRVYGLITAVVPGPMPQESVGPRVDGTVVRADGRPISPRYLVTSRALRVVGRRLADAPDAGIALWRVQPPLRLRTWEHGRDPVVRVILATARIFVFDCTSASVRATLRAVGPRTLTITPSGGRARTLVLAPGTPRTIAVPVRPGDRPQLCTVDVVAHGGAVFVPRLSVERR